MADSRFFPSAGPFSLAELADISGAQLHGSCDPHRRFLDISSLDEAGPDEVSFFDNRRYMAAFRSSGAGACIVSARFAELAPAGMSLLLSEDAYRGYARISAAFHPNRHPAPGIHPRAIVDVSSIVGMGVTIEAGAVIGPRVEIGAGCWIEANAVIGSDVVLGEQTRIGANASVSHALIGNRVRLYPGVRVGQDGFGFALGAVGHMKVPQVGRVLIGDDVEIGANTTIDRGSASDTVIGAGTVIDNLVQIGHNVHLGRGCVVVAQAGIAGSARLDDLVMVGGQAAIVGHIHLGVGVQVAGMSGVTRSVPAGQIVGGFPAIPIKEFRRLAGLWRRMARKALTSRDEGGKE